MYERRLKKICTVVSKVAFFVGSSVYYRGGRTSLHHACNAGHTEMVELLIQVGNTTNGTAGIIKGTVRVLSSDTQWKDDGTLKTFI